MREAGRINAEALAAASVNFYRPGVTTADLNAAAEEVLKKYGAYSPFKNYGRLPITRPVTSVSINEELVHGIPSASENSRKAISFQLIAGLFYEGFVAIRLLRRGGRNLCRKLQKLLEVTEQALYVGIAKMRAGNRIGDISAAIQQYVESHGFHVTREYTGHGVGRKMHEGPQVPNYGTAGHGHAATRRV